MDKPSEDYLKLYLRTVGQLDEARADIRRLKGLIGKIIERQKLLVEIIAELEPELSDSELKELKKDL